MKKYVILIVFFCLLLFLTSCDDQKDSDKPVMYLVAIKDGNYGVINTTGDEVLSFEYGKLSNVSPNGVMIHELAENNYELINLDGETLISGFEGLFPIFDSGIDYRFRQMIPYAFHGIKDGNYCAYDSSGEEFYCSETYKYLAFYEGRLQIAMNFYTDLSLVSKNLINTYELVIQTSPTAYFAQNSDSVYVLDEHGEIKHTYEDFVFRRFKDVVVIKNSERVYVFNHDGDMLINDPTIDYVDQPYGIDFLLVAKNNLIGLYDLNANKILDTLYGNINPVTNDFIITKKESDFEIYYKNQKINTVQNLNWYSPMIKMGYDDIYILGFNESNDLYYYKDDLVISPAYKTAYPFNHLGYAAVQLQSLDYALINMEFEITHQEYDSYKPFGNYFIVEEEIDLDYIRYGVINHLGEIILPIDYHQIFVYNDHIIASKLLMNDFEIEIFILDEDLSLSSLFGQTLDEIISVNLNINHYYSDYFIDGYINYHFPLSEDTVYEITDFLNEEFLIATKEGKVGVIDSNQNILIPFIYDQIFGCLPE